MYDKKRNTTKKYMQELFVFFLVLCFHLSKQTANNFRVKLKLVIR